MFSDRNAWGDPGVSVAAPFPSPQFACCAPQRRRNKLKSPAASPTLPAASCIGHKCPCAASIQARRAKPKQTCRAITPFPRFPPGHYEIRVSREGFKTPHRDGIRLLTDDKARLDLVFELGALV